MKTIEYRRMPLLRNHSQYMVVSEPSEMLALNKWQDGIVFNEQAQRMGFDGNYKILCIYEVVDGVKGIHYQYDLLGGVKHLSEQLKAALPSELKEVFV
jgi:hypothetical protein